MINVSYDQERNVVIVEFAGKIEAGDVDRHFADLQRVVPRHGKGFKVLTDLSAVEEVDPEAREPFKKAMQFLNERGVTEVIRVIPDPAQDIGLGIMSSFHYSKDVKFLTLPTREEAQAFL